VSHWLLTSSFLNPVLHYREAKRDYGSGSAAPFFTLPVDEDLVCAKGFTSVTSLTDENHLKP
jgi:hypothetical protein